MFENYIEGRITVVNQEHRYLLLQVSTGSSHVKGSAITELNIQRKVYTNILCSLVENMHLRYFK